MGEEVVVGLDCQWTALLHWTQRDCAVTGPIVGVVAKNSDLPISVAAGNKVSCGPQVRLLAQLAQLIYLSKES